MTRQQLEEKLKDLRERYKTASPSMKKFYEQGAKLLKTMRLEDESRA